MTDGPISVGPARTFGLFLFQRVFQLSGCHVDKLIELSDWSQRGTVAEIEYS